METTIRDIRETWWLHFPIVLNVYTRKNTKVAYISVSRFLLCSVYLTAYYKKEYGVVLNSKITEASSTAVASNAS